MLILLAVFLEEDTQPASFDTSQRQQSLDLLPQATITPQEQQFAKIAADNGLTIAADGSLSLSTWLDIAGTWYDESAGQYVFTQSNTLFSVNISTTQGNSQAVGLITGQQLYFTDAIGTVEEDERHMQVILNTGEQLRLHKEHQQHY